MIFKHAGGSSHYETQLYIYDYVMMGKGGARVNWSRRGTGMVWYIRVDSILCRGLPLNTFLLLTSILILPSFNPEFDINISTKMFEK